MTPRGGYRGPQAIRKTRKIPTTKATIYKPDYEDLKALSEYLKIPVVEVLHRILKSPGFEKAIDAIKDNITENWHEQEL